MAKRITKKTTVKPSRAKAAPKRRTASAGAKAKKSGTSARSTKSSGTGRSVSSSKRKSVALPKTSAVATAHTDKKSPKKTVSKAAAKKNTRATKTVKASEHPEATSQDPIQFPEQKPLPKIHLSAKELREFRERLLQKRAELAGDVRRLHDEALHKTGAQRDQSSMPIHMADLGTDNWEQEFTLGLLASEQALVREIDDALERIQAKTYGVCLATHEKISLARLRAKPWAKYCIEYARAREEGSAL